MKEIVRILIVLSFLAPLIFPAEATPAEGECALIQLKLDLLVEHTGCEEHSDCIAIDLPPPYGCNCVVNRSYRDEVEQAAREYQRSCGPFLYNCKKPFRKLVCEDGQCKTRPAIPTPFPNNAPQNRHGRPLN